MQIQIPQRRLSLIAAAIIASLSATGTQASSHAEAPFIKSMPKVDATDFYAFNSYEPGRDGYVTLIANYWPLQYPGGGPGYFSMDSRALYEIHVDNDGDAVEDLTFQFRFQNDLGGDGDGLALNIDGQTVAVPLQHIGQFGSGDNSGVQNYVESYSVAMVSGDRRRGSASDVTDAVNGTTQFAKPYDNAGDKTYPGGYDAYVTSLSNSGATYQNVVFNGCPAGAQMGRVFVGQRQESFSVALGEIFDLVNFTPLVDFLPDDPGRNELAAMNITTLAVEVHKDCLTGDGNGVIGGWTSASLPQVQILDPTPTADRPAITGGAWTQVSRLGSPLVNEVVIGLPDKDRFNASEPKDDGQFASYVTNPTLPAILDILFRDAVGATDNIAPSNFPRNDLVTAFLTGFAGVNQQATVTASEMLRLNTGVPATPRDSQHSLGVVAGDLAGFPNGRRPGDDVTDIALRATMGALCHPIAVDLDASGTAGDAGDNLGLCAPEDAPVGTAAFTDGAPQNAAQFDNAFPYLTTPLSGSPQS
jgi:hypothetical protein